MKRHAVRHGAEIAARGRSRVCGRGGGKGNSEEPVSEPQSTQATNV